MIDLYKLTAKTQTMSLLYVEDNDMVREDTYGMLNIFFKDIKVAINGAEGLEYYQKGNYDLIITDIKMPIMDGITMIEKIREENKEIAVIVISAHDEDYNLRSTAHLGIEGYIQKPFKVDDIIATIYKISNII